MTKSLLVMFLLICLSATAQKKLQSELKASPPPPGLYGKIIFSYDIEGNQIERKFCYGCTSKTASPAPIEIISAEDIISYYPNPVKEELYLKWELIKDNTVSAINVFGLNGQILKSYSGLTKTNSKNITFQNYPTGVYAVVLMCSNGEQKSIKIIKQ